MNVNSNSIPRYNNKNAKKTQEMNKIEISSGISPLIPKARSIENTTTTKMLKNSNQNTKKVGKKMRRLKKK